MYIFPFLSFFSSSSTIMYSNLPPHPSWSSKLNKYYTIPSLAGVGRSIFQNVVFWCIWSFFSSIYSSFFLFFVCVCLYFVFSFTKENEIDWGKIILEIENKRNFSKVSHFILIIIIIQIFIIYIHRVSDHALGGSVLYFA